MKYLSGICLSISIALFATLMGLKLPVIGAPVIAILTGMLFMPFIDKYTSLKPGLKFTSKKLLQLAIIILGFTLSLNNILESGKSSLPIIIATISIALITAYILTKVLKLDKNIGILVGVGSSICGGSAIAATAPVIDARDEEIAKSISVIFLFNVLAAITFPILGDLIGLSDFGFGVFAGTAINDTSSVTAASTVWDSVHNSSALETATIVKLTRTLAIIPITFILSIHTNKNNNSSNTKINIYKLIPTFIILFILASLITTVFDLPVYMTQYAKKTSKFLITMAMASIGLNTNFITLIKTGGKAILLGFICWLLISLSSIGMQIILGLL